MTIVGVILHWTEANSVELVVRQKHGRPQGVKTGAIPGGNRPPYNLQINFIHHDCVQF